MEKTDPEGLISTITASFTTYVGYLFGLMVLKLRKEPDRIVKYWLIFALICLAFVYPCSLIMPSNKRLYTITFVFITLCTCATVLSLFIVLVDILPKKYPETKSKVQKLIQPMNWLGLNPLAVFILLQLVGDIMGGWI
jgi:predicted acyltransferase